MPRQARRKSASGIYHIMFRGINRQNVFEADEDRRKFLEIFGYYKKISKYSVYAYCLMDNHIHLLIGEKDESISQIIKRISSSYVHWYNEKYNRCGHLFQERFKSEVVENEAYFIAVLRYIHQNPIKAGMTKNIGDYRWSSYQEYIGIPVITDIDFVLEFFSANKREAVASFIEYIQSNSDDECLEYHEKEHVNDEEIIDFFRKIGISNISNIQRLEKVQRNAVLIKSKEINGVTTRQLARITGISKSLIAEIWRGR